LGGTSRLYLNQGGGEFKAGSLSFTGSNNGASWADFDNDGFLDLFVSGGGNVNGLYHNNGDSTFVQISTGSIVTDRRQGSADSYWGLWFDYNNDGFLDLFVVNGDDPGLINTRNFLYRNNGNSNSWLKVKLIGTTSNRDAVGAKVRVRANYAGQWRWQRRDINGGDMNNGGQRYAHFGLGNATKVTTLSIEWPSGTVQEFSNIATNQTLVITEPRRPVLSVNITPIGFEGRLVGDPNQSYQVLASDDLLTGWASLTTVTTGTDGTASWTDSRPAPQGRRFYRAQSAP